MKIPWTEVLKRKRREGADVVEKPNPSVELGERDLTPKRMSESFHRVVSISEELDQFLTD